jgi:Alpha/beta hydrolase of unknown function (DUF1400)
MITSFSLPGRAAETVILKYGILRESLTVPELTTFAETGAMSAGLQAHLKLAHQSPEVVQKYLTQTVRINPILLDRALNSPVGNLILDEVSQAVKTPAGAADRQALRGALILSAQPDSNISILEVLQNYPTQDVLIDGDHLVQTYNQLNILAKRLQNPLGGIKSAFDMQLKN